ncbi:Rhodanese-like protein [Dacryopinax primogenitus]|uniref:M-phase inducer phosphatase n=1 Tax=Dacryopinax primogenitus (strain DJM 731) TaxID=1858805 RepID=M5G9K0_DACPD|nr:Rhodanese-like protein [Dacryopinax primogenitus]EJU05474.1 Rhodanese-like protein [Dacryopinax primogenitus]
MRRTLSLAAESDADSASASEASPLTAVQRAYAKRTNTRLVTHADGSPAFRPLRSGSGADARESCPQPGSGFGFGFGGFGHNEQEGKILPCLRVKDDGLMRITPETLETVLNGDYDAQLEALHIVDCRFDYEFAGGHIDGAVNLATADAAEDYFLRSGCGIPLPAPSTSRNYNGKKTVIIFHCEFSVKRAPTIAKHLRSRDRAVNAHCYPSIHFPEIYILQGGYYDFFKRSPAHCEPKGYVAMLDPRHATACSPSLGQFRQGTRWQRARSYTYGDSGMPRPKGGQGPVPLPLALPFPAGAAGAGSGNVSAASAAAPAAPAKKRRPQVQLMSVKEHSSSEDAFGCLGEPAALRPAPGLGLGLGLGLGSAVGLGAPPPRGEGRKCRVMDRAVSFRQ